MSRRSIGKGNEKWIENERLVLQSFVVLKLVYNKSQLLMLRRGERFL